MTTTGQTTAIDIDAIRARAEAATPGPWRVVEEHGRDIADEGWSQVTIQSEVGHRDEVAEMIDDERTDENAEFIAHAREDIPALLDEIDHLNGELDDRDAAISSLRADLDFQTRAAFGNQAEVDRLRAELDRQQQAHAETVPARAIDADAPTQVIRLDGSWPA